MSLTMFPQVSEPGRWCLVCQAPRVPADPWRDALAHAPCDQLVSRLDPDTRGEPTFWGSVGRAAYDG